MDSASLMNKGLEVIEARWLFDFEPERIKVVVHPESIVHSAVEFEDGAVIAQLGSADMRTPIAYSLGWPERLDGCAKRLSLSEIGRLTFEEPDVKTFPLLQAAYDALAQENGATIVLNAANEIAVEAFLEGRIGFTDIFATVRNMMEIIEAPLPGSVPSARRPSSTSRRAEQGSRAGVARRETETLRFRICPQVASKYNSAIHEKTIPGVPPALTGGTRPPIASGRRSDPLAACHSFNV